MDEGIIAFIKGQRCASICCMSEQNLPYCFSSFYAFNSKQGLLIYKTSADSHHAKLMKQFGVVAGTILPDKLNTLAIQGIQFTGHVMDANDPATKGSAARYYKRFPFGLAMPGDIWVIRLTEIKMTDNTKGFGTKIKWQFALENQPRPINGG